MNQVYSAVIFDLYGTLVDDLTSPRIQMTKYRRVLSEMAFELRVPADEFVRLWMKTSDKRARGEFPDLESNLVDICRVLGETCGADRAAEAVLLRVEFIRRALIPREDTIDTLRAIRESGHKVGLISDCGFDTVEVWRDSYLATLIDEAILSCSVGVKKPDPRIYQLACQRLEVPPDKCLYVGDGGSTELAGATEIGMQAVLIRAMYDDEIGGSREEWPGLRVSTLGGIMPLLEID